MTSSVARHRSRDPQQTRRVITEAFLDLVRETGRAPTADAIAARSGVSRRSVFVHFADLDELHVAAGRLQGERLRSVVEPVDAALPLRQRIDGLVDQLERVYETMTPVRRVALASRSTVVSALIDDADAWIRRMLQRVFAAELEWHGARLLPILEAAVSWGAWYQLRRLSPAERHDCFAEMVSRLIEQRDGSPHTA